MRVGKTIVAAKLIEELVRNGERVLFMAHRYELLQQAADKIKMATGLECSLEKAEKTCLGAWYRVVVGSTQTLMRENRLRRFTSDYFDTIIIDEAHHCLSDSNQKILRHFDCANILGITASPDRSDMRNLGQYFDSLAYEYSLPKAIKDGFLCPIKAQTIPLRLDLSAVTLAQGDFKAADLGTALDPYLHQIADEMVAYCKGRRTLVFLPLVKTAQKFAAILRDRRFACGEVNGESKDRQETLRRFACGDLDVLCNAMLLTEGWDCPSVDCIVVLRPTKIRSLYSQMVGRGTRLHPGKDHLLLLDFLWHTDRHELCHPAHLICSNDEMARQITGDIEGAPGAVDILEAEKLASSEVQDAREKALAKLLRDMRTRKKKLVDPLQFEMSIQAEDLSSYAPAFGWEAAPPSEKQIKTLEERGIFAGEIDNAGKASKLIDRLNKRQAEGLTTPRQIRLLENRGFLHVGTWQFETAKKLISRIASNDWRVPSSIIPAEYKGTANETIPTA